MAEEATEKQEESLSPGESSLLEQLKPDVELFGKIRELFANLSKTRDWAHNVKLQVVCACLLIASVVAVVVGAHKHQAVAADTATARVAVLKQVAASQIAAQPTFDFGPDIDQDQQDQIEDAVRIASDTLKTGAGVALGDLSVHAYSSNESLVDVYMKRFNFPEQKRGEILARLAAATAYTERDRDLFINTSSLGWNRNSPIAEGLVLPGRYWTVLHESFHLAQSKVKADRVAEFPMWLYECSAHYFAGRSMADNRLYDWDKIRQGQVAKAATVGEDLRSMETAAGFFEAGAPYADEYSLGFLAVEYLCADFEGGGSAKLMEFWSAVGGGKPWREAFEDTFDKSVDQFYSEFEDWRARGFQ